MTANDYDTPGVAGKRKRGMKSMSVTPSVIDDDDEERDMVS
jgi:ATP-dependent helicase STH1/SNF2